MYVSLCICTHVYVGADGDQKEALDPLELGGCEVNMGAGI